VKKYSVDERIAILLKRNVIEGHHPSVQCTCIEQWGPVQQLDNKKRVTFQAGWSKQFETTAGVNGEFFTNVLFFVQSCKSLKKPPLMFPPNSLYKQCVMRTTGVVQFMIGETTLVTW